VLWLAGCAHEASERPGLAAGLHGAWETPAGSRQVEVKADGRWVELGFRADGDDGEVRINQHVIRIERAHLILNGQTVAAISPDAQELEVALVGGVLTVSADGLAIYQGRPMR
jgi:hypothetical protein